jgi:hypothetical protein
MLIISEVGRRHDIRPHRSLAPGLYGWGDGMTSGNK